MDEDGPGSFFGEPDVSFGNCVCFVTVWGTGIVHPSQVVGSPEKLSAIVGVESGDGLTGPYKVA